MIKEIFLRQDLIWQLALKDLKVRYQRPAFGFLWLLLSPFITVAIFYFVFAVILKVKTDDCPFVLYLMSAVFPWSFFQDSLSTAATSLVDNRNLIRESNFPQYLIPVSIVLSKAMIFLPALVIVLIISFIMLKGLPILVFFLPLILVLHITVTLGLAFIFSIIYVRFRDIKYILDSLLMLIFYLTPAFYSLSLIKNIFPGALSQAYISNPFVGILGLYRLTLLKGFMAVSDLGIFSLVVIPVIFAIVALSTGLYLYKKNKNTINDYLSY